MRWLIFIVKTLLVVLIAAGLLFGALTAYGWEEIWEQAYGPPDLGPVEFEGLTKGPRPNQALVCPENLCADADVDVTSPVYDLPVIQLREELLNSLRSETDLLRVDNGEDPLKLRFVQRSDLMRFPDTIRVRIIPVGNTRSTLALYSQSQIGQSDLGVNLDRVNRWLARLDAFATQAD